MSLNIITPYISGSRVDEGDYYSLSKFIPLLTFTNIGRDITSEFDFISLVLKEPSFPSDRGPYSNASNKILSYLDESSFLRKVETNGLIIYIGKGVIYDEHKNILLCLTIETQHILDLIEKGKYSWSRIFPEYSNSYELFIMFVSTEFANDKKYAVLYRRIKKIYLDFCFEKGIEMRLISSSKIKENTFTNNLNVKFNSLTELNRHLTEDVKHLLLTPLEDFKENDFPLLLGNPPIPKREVESVVERGIHLHDVMEDVLIRTISSSGDSMLEDSDADERAFEQEIVQLNLENFPSQTLSDMMRTINDQSVTWEEPITSDRSMAANLAMLSSNRRSFRDMTTELTGISNRYFGEGASIGTREYIEDVRGATTNLLYTEDPFPDVSIDDVEEEQEDLPY